MTGFRWRAGIAIGFALALGGADMVHAGGSGLDDHADEEAGTPFFGTAKDLTARGAALADTKVTAELKGGNASLVTRTDTKGQFRIAGFGKDINPNQVEITCAKDGYKMERAVRRRASNDPGTPVEIDCLMVKP